MNYEARCIKKVAVQLPPVDSKLYLAVILPKRQGLITTKFRLLEHQR